MITAWSPANVVRLIYGSNGRNAATGIIMSENDKSIDELTICDNFMFVKVFSNEKIAKPFLKALLKVDIERVSIVGEARQEADPRKKFVRLDVMVKEGDESGIGRVFDLEMQMVDTRNLPLRARYYQGICDTETLESGHSYKELKEQYIIFLCPEDIFGAGKAIYEFQNREKGNPTLVLGDNTYKIFYNFTEYSCVKDKAVREYFEYFATNKATSPATEEIDNMVGFYRKDPKTRSDYVLFQDILKEERAKGIDIGVAKGIDIGVAKGIDIGVAQGVDSAKKELAKAFRDAGVPLEIISKQTGLSPKEIKAL